MRGLSGAKGAPLKLEDFTLGRLIEGRPAMTPEQAAAFHQRFLDETNPKP
jgi:hypothetical protein